MSTMESQGSLGLIATLLSGPNFHPESPKTIGETGLSDALVDSLICKRLYVEGSATGRGISETICLPFGIVDNRLQELRTRQMLAHKGSAAFNDYSYTLTGQGKEYTQILQDTCAYSDAAPVPLMDYIMSIDAQSITAEVPKRSQLEQAFRDISVPINMYSQLGPAVNSGAGLFLYGAPGNGKTTLAERITLCFGHEIWIPKAIIVDGQIIKLYDPAYHKAVKHQQKSILLKDDHDKRWIKIRRPTVVAGGELTMDSLEIRHDPNSNISEAPLQMKSNCGSLLIDDFGRQRMDPTQLLNRWIVPLEKRYDFLTLASGKKIQMTFDQLIIFSTNIEPKQLVDEAFLRRIPYKIHVADPDEAEFIRLCEMSANVMQCEFRPETIEYLLATHYRPIERPMRRCHPRDLMLQIHNLCKYFDSPMEMRNDYFDIAVQNYFTVVQ